MPVIFVDVTIVPIGTADTGVSRYVAACERLLAEFPDVRFKINPMSTTLEGELDRIFALIRRMHEAPFAQGAQRVSTAIRIDDRRDVRHTLEHKVENVFRKCVF
jgi:uncharacterized protein (TIGR00106 family)